MGKEMCVWPGPVLCEINNADDPTWEEQAGSEPKHISCPTVSNGTTLDPSPGGREKPCFMSLSNRSSVFSWVPWPLAMSQYRVAFSSLSWLMACEETQRK